MYLAYEDFLECVVLLLKTNFITSQKLLRGFANVEPRVSRVS